MKWVHIADLHIDENYSYGNGIRELNVRMQDLEKNLKEVINYILKETNKGNKISLLIAGDIYNKPDPTSWERQFFYKFLCSVLIARIEKIYGIPGTHDIGVTHALREFSLDLNGDCDYKIDFGGYESNDDMILHREIIGTGATEEKNIRDIFSSVFRSPRIVMLHCTINWSKYDNGKIVHNGLKSSLFESVLNKEKPCYVALGHHHNFQKFSWDNGRIQASYCGGLIRQDFGERNNKVGFNVWNDDTGSLIRINLKDRKFVIIKSLKKCLELLKSAKKKVKGNIFKLEMIDGNDFIKWCDMRERLLKAGALEVKLLNMVRYKEAKVEMEKKEEKVESNSVLKKLRKKYGIKLAELAGEIIDEVEKANS